MGRIVICAALITGIALAICWRHQRPLLAGEGTITAAQLEHLQARHHPVGLRAVHVDEHRITSLLPNPGADEIWFTTSQGLFALHVQDHTTRMIVGNTDTHQVLVSPGSARAGLYVVRELLGDPREARFGRLYPFRFQLVTGEQTTMIPPPDTKIRYFGVEYLHPAGLLLWEGMEPGGSRFTVYAITDLQGNRFTDLQFRHMGPGRPLIVACSDDGKYVCLTKSELQTDPDGKMDVLIRIYGMDGTGQQLWVRDHEPRSSPAGIHFSPDGTHAHVFSRGAGGASSYLIIHMPTGEILARYPLEDFGPFTFRQHGHQVGVIGSIVLLHVNLIDGSRKRIRMPPFICDMDISRNADVIYALLHNRDLTELRLCEIRPEQEPVEIGRIQVKKVFLFLDTSPLLRVTDTDEIYLAGDNVIWKVER